MIKLQGSLETVGRPLIAGATAQLQRPGKIDRSPICILAPHLKVQFTQKLSACIAVSVPRAKGAMAVSDKIYPNHLVDIL